MELLIGVIVLGALCYGVLRLAAKAWSVQKQKKIDQEIEQEILAGMEPIHGTKIWAMISIADIGRFFATAEQVKDGASMYTQVTWQFGELVDALFLQRLVSTNDERLTWILDIDESGRFSAHGLRIVGNTTIVALRAFQEYEHIASALRTGGEIVIDKDPRGKSIVRGN